MSIQETKQGKAIRLAVEKERDILTKAFGGCLKCYGKGYSTTTDKNEVRMMYCSCDRGAQLVGHIKRKYNKFLKAMFEDFREKLPEFIDHEYPKGKKNRGDATVAITLFLQWMEKSPHGVIVPE